jgi:hypothetical protein
MNDNTSGRRWSRFALGFGAVMSILGNETHTVLTPGHLNIVIRTALAVIWPVALFVAVEVLVRVNWRAQFIDYAGRVIMMIPVTIVAAVVSYQHLHALMGLAGEDSVSALIGPVAIDGLMVGGTVALLAIRAASLITIEPVRELPAPEEVAATQPIEPDVLWDNIDWDREMIEMNQPVSPAPIPVVPGPVKERAPRAKWDARQVCELAVQGVKASDAHTQTGVGQSTYDRYARVARILKEDPRAAIDPGKKVPAEHVEILRELVRR